MRKSLIFYSWKSGLIFIESQEFINTQEFFPGMLCTKVCSIYFFLILFYFFAIYFLGTFYEKITHFLLPLFLEKSGLSTPPPLTTEIGKKIPASQLMISSLEQLTSRKNPILVSLFSPQNICSVRWSMADYQHL